MTIRKLRRIIAADKEKIESFDMEEAAKARRQFDEKYAAEKKREADMEAEVRVWLFQCCVTSWK